MKFLHNNKGTYKLYSITGASRSYPVKNTLEEFVAATSLEEALLAWRNKPGRDKENPTVVKLVCESMMIVSPEEKDV